MAEPRRVQLTTLAAAAAAAPACYGAPAAAPVVPEPEPEPRVETVRLVVSLFEPDERTFPELSYRELLEGKALNVGAFEIGPPAKEEAAPRRWEDEELVGVAKRMEQKYGGKPKKKREDRVQDLIDIGYGYDDEDSFIDNSEAYDEFVPSAITTKWGGFYVNSGVLHFREASDSDGVRTVEDDDDEEEDEEEVVEEGGASERRKKRKLHDGQERQQQKKKKAAAACSANGEQTAADINSGACGPGAEEEDARKKKKKRKKPSGPLSVTSMLRKFQREKERERQRMERAAAALAPPPTALATPPMALLPADAAGGGGPVLADSLLGLIGSTSEQALMMAASAAELDLDLDCLLDLGAAEGAAPSAGGPPSPAAGSHPPSGPPLPPDADTAPSPPALLDGLPPLLEDAIRRLVLAVKTSEGEPRGKVFSPEINALLLEIEARCEGLSVPLRSRVLTHLTTFLPCGRDALNRRLKKLTLAQAKAQPMAGPLQKLKEAIGRAMAEQLVCFQESCRLYEQLKAAKGEEEGAEERGGKRYPRKWFKWNEEVRQCFGQALREKLEVYKCEGKSGPELEEQLRVVLESEIKPLWPRGWIQSRVLIRECRKMFGLFSSLPVKKAPTDRKLPEGTASLPGPPPPADPAQLYSISSASLPPELHVFRAAAAAGVLDPQDPPLPASHQLLAAAVAKYKRSLQHWSPGAGSGSPPLPPPPPQSSPVSFQPPLPGLPRAGFGERWDEEEVTVISDDDDAAMQ